MVQVERYALVERAIWLGRVVEKIEIFLKK